MNAQEHYLMNELANAYLALREAFHKDMGKDVPPLTPLQERVQEALAQPVCTYHSLYVNAENK